MNISPSERPLNFCKDGSESRWCKSQASKSLELTHDESEAPAPGRASTSLTLFAASESTESNPDSSSDFSRRAMDIEQCPVPIKSSHRKSDGKGKSAEMDNNPEAEATGKKNWNREITEKLLRRAPGLGHLSVYKVPKKLRRVKDEAYAPRVVSIGPFHLSNDGLAAIREHKWQYMQHFSERIKDLECLKNCNNAIFDLDADVRGCYSEKIDISKSALAEIMLLDGCFILELFLRYDQHFKGKFHDESDPIFNSAWMIAALQHDLSLLENQIPFFILERLYDAMKPHHKDISQNSVTSLALQFFQMEQAKKEEPDTKYHHLLDLLHQFYLPNHLQCGMTEIRPDHTSFSVQVGNETKIKIWGFNLNASNLLRAGIEFEKGEGNLLNITFSNGKLRIPPVYIHLTSDSLFRNLVAYDQCSLRSTHHITSYLILMKSLITSTRDIRLLRERGIINLLNPNRGGDQEYFAEFKTILNTVVVKDFCFGKLCDEVKACSKSWLPLSKHKVSIRVRIHRHASFLYRTYFSSPWSIISFVAATALFVLTVIQTYYSIHPR